ncbi:MAG: proline dehydrogenase family protein [Gaiellales bacterium]
MGATNLIDRALATSLPVVPRPVVRHFASRYMAGERLGDAVATVRELNRREMSATVDVLGEFIKTAEEADATVAEYERFLGAIAEHNLDAHISVKLSAIGLELDTEMTRANALRLAREAERVGSFMRIDMEHSGLTDDTLRVYRALREEGIERVGIVIQAYMRRSLSDLRNLADLQPRVRLVKGIYVEPKEVAYTDPGIISRNFLELLEHLVSSGSHVAVATHDRWLVDEALRVIDRHRLGPDAYEFQMLLGVTEQLRDQLVAQGHHMRVYVPYGQAWYGYSVRRLRENPSIAGYVARDVLRAMVPGVSRG